MADDIRTKISHSLLSISCFVFRRQHLDSVSRHKSTCSRQFFTSLDKKKEPLASRLAAPQALELLPFTYMEASTTTRRVESLCLLAQVNETLSYYLLTEIEPMVLRKGS